MVLRIHFTPEDLLKVRVAGSPHPLWELVLSINSLQQPELPLRFRGWRDRVLRRAREQSGGALSLQAACSVVPLAGNFADLLTPNLDEPDPQAHFDSMLALPKPVVQADLTRTYRKGSRRRERATRRAWWLVVSGRCSMICIRPCAGSTRCWRRTTGVSWICGWRAVDW
ncbi:hypothetical protein [Kribbella solani]|uniref:Transcriptional regulator n=1 Tax=Kribbella solani TaxID=236067 RepID=A0A841DQ54_9ACTN|nr:hypothetical protein [Kribbella solani]MBB5979979.1 hypothetical protein [Kribbella solani]